MTVRREENAVNHLLRGGCIIGAFISAVGEGNGDRVAFSCLESCRQ